MATSDAARKFANSVRSFMGAALLRVLIDTNPVPASRPRVSRFGTYYAKGYKQWMKEAGEIITYDGPKLTGPVFVLIETIVEKPKSSKLDHPSPDVDNYAKAVLDAMTKHGQVWGDDKQVIGLAVMKRFADPGESAGSYVTLVEAQ